MKKLLLLLGLIFLMGPFLYGEEVKPTENTKGCLMCFCNFSGGGTTKLFVKVADSEYDDPDTGEHQIWGYNPMNKRLDSKGKIIFERAAEKDFLKAGRAGHKEGQPCMFKCPLW